MPQRVTIQDLVRGEVSWDAEATVGDFILLRSTGVPVYNFCVAGKTRVLLQYTCDRKPSAYVAPSCVAHGVEESVYAVHIFNPFI